MSSLYLFCGLIYFLCLGNNVKWRILTSKTFKKSFQYLHPDIKSKIQYFFDEQIETIDSIFELNNFKRIKTHKNYGRFKFGDYRVGVYLDSKKHCIVLCYVGTRGDFYKHFPR